MRYHHLAGRLGVACLAALERAQFLSVREGSLVPTPSGIAWFEWSGPSVRRWPPGKPCLDWTERKNHLGGPLGALLAERFFALDWIARCADGRAVRVTETGQRELARQLALPTSALSSQGACAMTVSLRLVDTPLEEARASIVAGLDDYNIERTNVSDNTALMCPSSTSSPIEWWAGSWEGHRSASSSSTTSSFLPPSVEEDTGPRSGEGRGGGVRRGCSSAVLFTMNIQAPLFYEKQGYEAFGRVECNPPGNARIFMKKELRSVER